MQVGSNGYNHSSEVAKTKAMMHQEGEKVGKGYTEQTAETVPLTEEPAAVIETSPEYEANIMEAEVEQMIADEVEVLDDEQNPPSEETASKVSSDVAQKIIESSSNDISLLQKAMETISGNMKETSGNSYEAKNNILELLQNKIDQLTA